MFHLTDADATSDLQPVNNQLLETGVTEATDNFSIQRIGKEIPGNLDLSASLLIHQPFQLKFWKKMEDILDLFKYRTTQRLSNVRN